MRERRSAIREREAAVLQLRARGMSFSGISGELGLSSASSAHRIYRRALDATVHEAAADLRRLEAARLDALQCSWWSDAAADESHVQMLMEQIAKSIDGAEYVIGYDSSGEPSGVGVGFVTTRNSAGRQVVSALLLIGDAIRADTLRQVQIAAFENQANLTQQDVDRDALDALGPMRRDAANDPEDFSRRVAEHYKLWARAVPNPAAAMAAEHGVKLPTMHGWIREARLRGFLPPAKRGKQ